MPAPADDSSSSTDSETPASLTASPAHSTLTDEFFVDGAALERGQVAVDRLPGLSQFRVYGG
jgi:hypothetical protein